VDYLIEDEPGRAFLTSMVACLFARSVYNSETIAECLAVSGFESLAGAIDEAAERIRKLRWRVRVDTGFKPEEIEIPQRFYSVSTIQGPVDAGYLNSLKAEYGRRILNLLGDDPEQTSSPES